MKRYFRLFGYFSIGLLLGAVATFASAETIPATLVQNSTVYPTCTSTCQVGCIRGRDFNTYWLTKNESSGALQCSAQNGNPAVYNHIIPKSVYDCPDTGGWSLVNTNQCTRPDCLPGEIRDEISGACKPQPCESAGTPATGTGLIKATANHSPELRIACTGGCITSVAADCPTHSAVVNGVQQLFCTGRYEYTGGNVGDCTPSAQNAPEILNQPPPNTCAEGQFGGTVNGEFKCYNDSGVESPTTPPVTSTSTTTVSDTTNADGSTTRTTTTTNSDGTTTVTTENFPNGVNAPPGPSSSETVTTGQRDSDRETTPFCEENPESPICKKSTVTGGDICANIPACDGDAAQCAIVMQTWATRCEIDKLNVENELSVLGNTVDPTATVDQSAIDRALNRDGTFDFDIYQAFQDNQQTYLDYSGSCPVPESIDFMGRTYALNTGIVCSLGTFTRFLIHIVAYMGLLRVLSRSFG